MRFIVVSQKVMVYFGAPDKSRESMSFVSKGSKIVQFFMSSSFSSFLTTPRICCLEFLFSKSAV